MHMRPSDERLAAQAGQGDSGAFDELVRRHYRRVYAIAYRMLGQTEEASEVAQEAFIRAYRNLYRFDASRSFAAWLTKIVTNLAINAAQRRPRAASPTEGDPDEPPPDIPDRAPGPVDILERRELHRRVHAALLSLPPAQRAVAVLRHTQGLGYEEISDTLGIPIGTVKSHIFRAKDSLREQLADLFETAR
jgi:RNA polymerase sigma-70 factor (ECF subfamily)